MRLLILLLATTLVTFAAADNHDGQPAVGEGAFVTLMVQAKDPDAYIEVMKQNWLWVENAEGKPLKVK